MRGGRLKIAATLLPVALGLFLAALPCRASAQSDEFVNGEVVKIDEAASKITIKHEPLRKFNMETGMTMVFRVLNPALLENLHAGDKIKFVPDRENNQFTVTKIEKAK
jgi:Cu/Ag efflux protein CusF